MSDGVCLRFVLDTYEQEIERYGGLAGMAAAEAIFAADSRCAADLPPPENPSEQLTATPSWLSPSTISRWLGLDEPGTPSLVP
jgi:thiopeptide-type bacteriocin biosynthesis protein